MRRSLTDSELERLAAIGRAKRRAQDAWLTVAFVAFLVLGILAAHSGPQLP